jgi:protein TonB
MWFLVLSRYTFTSANHLNREKEKFESKKKYKPYKIKVMNILGNNSSKLNEVIFENRNKNYGAYAIRQSYNDSLMKSIICLSSIIVLVFGSAFAYNKATKTPSEEKLTIFSDPALDPIEYTTKVDLTPITKPVENTAAAAAPAGVTTATTIIDDATEPTTPTNLTSPITGVGTETATGISPEGTGTLTTINPSVTNLPYTTPTEAAPFADEMPEFDGGATGLMRYVGQNIVYPTVAREIGIEGTVYVSFIVNEFGNVESAKVLKGIGYGCDEEVIRVVNKMPRWKKVGKNAGHPVKVRFNIPVAFRLQ